MDKQIVGRGFEYTDEFLGRIVHEKKVMGVSAYVARGGKALHRRYMGWADAENRRPIGDDTIYRMYSATKPATVVALLQLYERGLFRMYDPVCEFLPGFRDQKVFVEPEPGKAGVVDAKRPVLMRDLFTMTSGIPYGGQDDPASRAMSEAGKAMPEGTDSIGMMNLLGKVPLAFHPGEHWRYGYSIDVLAAVLEVITGKRLGDYMKENIFEPLGMGDTGFYLSPRQAERLGVLYHEENGELTPPTPGTAAYGKDPCARPAIDSGGGGLYSSLDDYISFVQMLAGGGTLGGAKVLSRKTVDLMRQNHLTPAQRATCDWDLLRGYGYGLGVRVRLENDVAGSNGSVGEWGWDGMAGTYFCIDPVENMIALFMIQREPGLHYELLPRFLATVYGAF